MSRRVATHPGFFRRMEREQERLLRSTMPKSGVVEYDNLLPSIPLTGKVWRDGAATWNENVVMQLVDSRKAVR